MKKIVLLTNAMTPYRKELYRFMFTFFKEKGIIFKVLCEVRRTRNWDYEELKDEYTELLNGITLKYKNVEFPINYGIAKKIKEENPDILIIGGSWATPTNYLFNLKKYKVIFWHESNLLGIKRITGIKANIWNFLRQRFYNKINIYMVPGERAKEAVLEWKKGKNIYFIPFPNTIEELEYKKKKIEYSKKRKIFLIVARLTKVKGLEEFILGIKKIILNEEVKIIIAGEGELKATIEKLIKENNLEEKIELIGYVNSKQLSKYYEKADFFILPSLYDPSPLSVIEALYYNLPILISNKLGNCPEVLNKNGYCFNPFDNKEIEEKFKKVLNWTDSEYEMSVVNSQKIYGENFNKQKIVEKLYKELIKIK